MKRIFVLVFLICTASAQAQFFKKLKEKAEKAVLGKDDAKTETNNTTTANQNNKKGNDLTLSGYTYLTAEQAAEKFGKKIHALQKGQTLLQADYTGWNMTDVHAQYWLENNDIKYYFSVGKYTGGEADALIFEEVRNWDGTVYKKRALESSLPLSNPKQDAMANNFGTFEQETSEFNFKPLDADRYFTVDAKTTAAYKMLTSYNVKKHGKTYGPYEGIGALVPIYNVLTNDLFYGSVSYDENKTVLYKNGQTIQTINLTVPGGLAFLLSPNSKTYAYGYIDADNTNDKLNMIYKFNNGKTIKTESYIIKDRMMNSGQLLRQVERGEQGYEEGKYQYKVNQTETLETPEYTTFFSDETVYKWACMEQSYTLFFSDKIAIQQTKSYKNELAYKAQTIFNPKKMFIAGKTYLVWLQVVNDTDVYLCKKEL